MSVCVRVRDWIGVFPLFPIPLLFPDSYEASLSDLRQQLLTEQGKTSALTQELSSEKQRCLDVEGKLTTDLLKAQGIIVGACFALCEAVWPPRLCVCCVL